MSTRRYYQDDSVTLYHGDALTVLQHLPATSVNSVVTSPPYYGLRDYGVDGQYGLEASPAEYIETMRRVFTEVRRVLADDGTLWLNLGDSYTGHNGGASGSKFLVGEKFKPGSPKRTVPGVPKNLLGIPWRVAFALQDDGWILRNAIVWHKPNPMPGSQKDRLTNAYEHVFLFSRSPRYWFDLDAIKIPSTGQRPGNTPAAIAAYAEGTGTTRGARRWGGNESSTLLDIHETRNPGDVWSIPTQPFPDAHYAVMTPRLAERCVMAGCKPGGTVLDPFSGTGTTGMAAARHGRRYIGIDLDTRSLDMSLKTRLAQTALIDDEDEAVS